MDAPVWDVTVFTKNRDRLLRGDVAQAFFQAMLADPRVTPLLSSEHFLVDGTLIETWASMKSVRPKDGSGVPQTGGRNGERDFHREKRSNETHASTTDPAARLAPRLDGQPAKLCYAGHVVMENRSGLVVAVVRGRGRSQIAQLADVRPRIPICGRVTSYERTTIFGKNRCVGELRISA